jgi:hypothetical protein
MKRGKPQQRFGTVAMKKGFVTKKQFIKAQGLQIKDKMDKKAHRTIGQIMLDLGYLTSEQIEEVLAEMGKKTR